MKYRLLIASLIVFVSCYSLSSLAEGKSDPEINPSNTAQAAMPLRPNAGSAAFSESVLKAVLEGKPKQVAEYFEHHNISIDTQDEYGATALLHASVNGRIEILKYLLKKGANPNLADYCGNTPLLFATVVNSAEMISLLLSRGANPHTINFRKLSPLSIVKTHKRENLIKAYSKVKLETNFDENFSKCIYKKDLEK